MIDLDEYGVQVQSAERHWGKALVGKRVNQTGPYSKLTKINLLLAILGDDDTNNRLRWSKTWASEGTMGNRW